MANQFCEQCGNALPEGTTFCQNCGTPCMSTETPAETYIPYQGQTAPIPTVQPTIPPVQPIVAAPVIAYQDGFSGKTGKGLGWITFLRVFYWIVFALIELSVLGSAVALISDSEEAILPAIALILGGTLAAFLVVAAGMISLNNATNLRSIAMNTARTVELLQDIKKK